MDGRVSPQMVRQVHVPAGFEESIGCLRCFGIYQEGIDAFDRREFG